ncbi:putative apoptosis inducing factor [Tieghemostelium lacteum]|uniref:Putative apoptosis inducing factor n=1 Tax=Tieghemostelium lacteum TaxID=361077 RepID=A0A151ZGQ9_TIELA|nr:putative apoptosis inducing factor [Tieghemostelium lacteum]|eukprot:KYQ93161.1 putative apoptosis inducing factor [Tieghemostelium lacteum]
MKNGRVINKVAREIGIDRVILEDGEEVAFDYLVIATGSNNPAPFKTLINVNEAPTYINSISEQVAQAKKILIVGGGAVGVEVAGEIVYKYTDKEVTIVNSTDKLISNVFKEKFHQLLEKKLKTHRVEVVTDKIAFPDDIKELLKTQSAIPYQCERKTYTTESGKQIEADLVFWTVGNKLNNEPLQTHFAGVLNDQGRIKVNNSLQVEGYQNIFAIGDINSISELKTSYHATSHAETAASNINAIESAKDKNNVKLKEHKSQSPMMVASFGPKDGVGQVYGLVISGFVSVCHHRNYHNSIYNKNRQKHNIRMNIISPVNKSLALLETKSPTLKNKNKSSPYQSPSLSPSSKFRLSQHREEIQALSPLSDNTHNTIDTINASVVLNKLQFNSQPNDNYITTNTQPTQNQLSNSTNTFYEININDPPQLSEQRIPTIVPNTTNNTTSGGAVINFNELMANNAAAAAASANNAEVDEDAAEEARLQLENRNRIIAEIQQELARTSLMSNFTRFTIAYGSFGISLVLATVIMFIVGFLKENETIIFSGIVTSPIGFLMINHSIHMAYRRSRRRIQRLHEQQQRLENPEPIDMSQIPSKLQCLSIDILSSMPTTPMSPDLVPVQQQPQQDNNQSEISTIESHPIQIIEQNNNTTSSTSFIIGTSSSAIPA